MKAAGNNTIYPLGKVHIDLNLGNINYKIEATVIKSCPVPIILGMQFLFTHNAIINFDNGTIRLNLNEVQFLKGNRSDCVLLFEQKEFYKIMIRSDLLLRLKEEMEIPLQLDEPFYKR